MDHTSARRSAVPWGPKKLVGIPSTPTEKKKNPAKQPRARGNTHQVRGGGSLSALSLFRFSLLSFVLLFYFGYWFWAWRIRSAPAHCAHSGPWDEMISQSPQGGTGGGGKGRPSKTQVHSASACCVSSSERGCCCFAFPCPRLLAAFDVGRLWTLFLDSISFLSRIGAFFFCFCFFAVGSCGRRKGTPREDCRWFYGRAGAQSRQAAFPLRTCCHDTGQWDHLLQSPILHS